MNEESRKTTIILNKFTSPIAVPLKVGTAVIIRWMKNNPSKVISDCPRISAKSSIVPFEASYSGNTFSEIFCKMATGMIAKTVYCARFIRLDFVSSSNLKICFTTAFPDVVGADSCLSI